MNQSNREYQDVRARDEFDERTIIIEECNLSWLVPSYIFFESRMS